MGTEFDLLLKNLPPEIAAKMRAAANQRATKDRELLALWDEIFDVVNSGLVQLAVVAYAGAHDEQERQSLVSSCAFSLSTLASLDAVVKMAPAAVRQPIANGILKGIESGHQIMTEQLVAHLPEGVKTRAEALAIRTEAKVEPTGSKEEKEIVDALGFEKKDDGHGR